MGDPFSRRTKSSRGGPAPGKIAIGIHSEFSRAAEAIELGLEWLDTVEQIAGHEFGNLVC